MATDKNGTAIKPGMRILVLAIVEAIPEQEDGPITVKIGNGEAPGSNMSVHGKHLCILPDNPLPPVPVEEASPVAAGTPVVTTMVVNGKLVHVGDIKVAAPAFRPSQP